MDTTIRAQREEQRALNRVARVRELAARDLTAGQIGVLMGKRAAWVNEIAAAHDIPLRLPRDDRAEVPGKAAPVRFALIDDPEPKVIGHKRRGHCLRLVACEDEWIAAHAKTNINAAGACPKDCPGVAR